MPPICTAHLAFCIEGTEHSNHQKPWTMKKLESTLGFLPERVWYLAVCPWIRHGPSLGLFRGAQSGLALFVNLDERYCSYMETESLDSGV